MDYQKEIRCTLQDLRRQALSQFMNSFMEILHAEGYTFEDLLEVVTTLASEKPEFESVVKHLENAEKEIRLQSGGLR
ncbi:hypothetical protein VF14_03330 [Nostoc linckia z18]|uniref:Uncharacterized protein n=2 Tax=Nostoc linckia TaxID=92942 RepID=A0A9Q6END6_NOSLI|nr:hypothetical protein [Nostoc linckia]PHK42408.1 hypothetical protein VF12_03345 [Nostoc linckia z15]PHK46916.1 hypothetical protein VF13_07970 [Nostoc linckia z16]PHJ69178.1 hypothetical protein VF02_00800 [Nostoc linckia z1]PHJ73329.1 hypothetical protein VF05_01815 [Nostoc linckia z3]PHJ78676.1 hypothetical protein VF03_00800 [Nostoc linckia z2]